MRDLPIGRKMLVAFGAILVMLCLTVCLAVFGLFSTGNSFDEFYNGSYEVTKTCAEQKESIQTLAKFIGYSMMESDVGKTAEYIDSAKAQLDVLRDGVTYLKENFDGDLKLVEEYENTMKSIMEDRDKVLELALANQNDEAISLWFSTVMPGFMKANDYLVKIGESAEASASGAFGTAGTQKTVVTVILMIISVAALATTIGMAQYLIKSITTPVHELEKAAVEMSHGSLDVEITYESKDELGSLAASMKVMTNGIRKIVEDVGTVLGELANGNFHVRSGCPENYVGDYEPIIESIRALRDNLNSTLLEINESTRQVAAGAAQMAQNAQGLAEGATEQAGAVEELTATVEDVTNMAEAGSADAQEAFVRVNESSEKAEGSKKDMEELIQAMERISESSKQIENIIADIADIASQTNLLSLNASIEAARAGEAGRGFAVVADQIGKLAADSAQSAVNTKDLISRTLEEIQIGNHITMKTSKAFEEVIEEMKNFAQVARKTSDSSDAQTSILKQVKSGIEQISVVVQSNSAAAEETSATSEELSAQVDNLDAQVSKFNLIEA